MTMKMVMMIAAIKMMILMMMMIAVMMMMIAVMMRSIKIDENMTAMMIAMMKANEDSEDVDESKYS